MMKLLFSVFFLAFSLHADGTWVYEEAFPAHSSELGSKLFFQTDDRLCGIETTFLHLSSGYHLILNFKWAPLEYQPTLPIKIEKSNGTKEVVDAKLLKGGHRLIIPPSASKEIALSLLKGERIFLSIESYKATLLPANLHSLWSRFTKLGTTS